MKKNRTAQFVALSLLIASAFAGVASAANTGHTAGIATPQQVATPTPSPSPG